MKTLFFIMFAAFFLSAIPAEQEPLLITITNIKEVVGNVRIGIYKSTNDFPDEKNTYKNKIYKISKAGTITLKISDLPCGNYAIALYQDKNKNGTMDKNFAGIPKEPFAFTNNIKPRFSAPSFEDCEITYSEINHKITVNLLNY
jgi:uncharacterized protein (DUF2141 family)